MSYQHFTTREAAQRAVAQHIADGFIAYVLELNHTTFEVRAWKR